MSQAPSVPNPGSGSVTVSVEPGERVTCTFENAQHGEIIVAKSALDGDDTFSFISATLGDFDLLTSSGVAQQSFPGLKSGLYDVGENALAGWDLTDVTCDDGSEPDAIDLQPGETVTCTFENSKRGEIVVVKNAIGGDDDFEFYSDKLGGFTLTTMGGTDSTTFTDLIPGPYAVAESDLPAGWDLTDATCDDGSTPNAITLDAGETVTCTFENTKRGQIDVVKQTLGDDGTFEFTSSTLPSLTIETTGGTTVTTGIGTASYPLLTPGTYDLQETAQTGWDLTSATCDNGTPGAIVVASGETTTCTFENSKRATLIVSKLTDPKASDEAFVFNVNGGPDGIDETFSLKDAESQDIVNLQPGTGYSVIETLPADWELQDATCSDGSAPAAIQLDPGETVECTFTNMDPTVPVTLGWFLAERNGDRVDFRWQTATETGTAGFNILALTESEAVQLNEALIPSTVIDSVEPTDYAFSAVTDATSFLLQEVEITGALNLRGPFMIGVESGVYSGVNAKDSYQIWLPLMMR